MLVGKPGIDGHSYGAEQIAIAARDSGIEVVYEGIRLTPARIANAAIEEGLHIVSLSILSGSHMPLVKEVLRRMRDLGIGDVPVVVGGIIPPKDARSCSRPLSSPSSIQGDPHGEGPTKGSNQLGVRTPFGRRSYRWRPSMACH